jgi:1-acyl-sn-glycerol-3-phosphate acyltransferase
MERAAYRIGDTFSRRAPWVSAAMNWFWGRWIVWLFTGRRFVVHGKEHLSDLTRQDHVVLVANHRTFYDFFVVMTALWFHSRAPLRLVFPVRGKYYYDHVTGPLVNFVMSGYSMFPPILRDRRGVEFNRFSQDRMVDEVRRPGTLLGMHPEGTRNKGPDPYALLAGRPGTGVLLRRAPEAKVIPVFVLGLTNNGWLQLWQNWTDPSGHPIDIVFGPRVVLDDLLALPDHHSTHMRIVERCMAAIRSLAETQRALRGATSPRPSERAADPAPPPP